METFSLLIEGFRVALSFQNIGAALIGGVLGLIVGAMPGIGSLAGCALLLPLTFHFNPTTAIIMLGSIYYANMFGGAFSAILINIPGDAPAIMTALDGFAMTKKGQPGKALFISNYSSFIGGLIGMVILVFLGPALASFGLNFGPSEMTMLMLVALTSISWLVGDNPIPGIIAACLGMMISTLGVDMVSGQIRYNFGSMWLLGGINFIPLVIGFIGMTQLFDLVEQNSKQEKMSYVNAKIRFRDTLLTKDELKRSTRPSITAGILGTFVGFLPGAGATAASFLGYAMEKKLSDGKTEVPLGEGAIEGLSASESANNAAAAGAFGPLLALGIPGSGTTAVLLGGLMMWGLNPGPMLFTTEPDFAWGLIASLFISNILALAISLGCIPWLQKIVRVPLGVMIPSIMVICFIGSYSTSNSMFGVVIMLIGGFLGYIFSKCGLPTAPLLLANVLAGTLETNLRRAFLTSDGNLAIFLERPITDVFLVIFLTMILFPVGRIVYKKIKNKKEK